jgi:hypothetical protein
MVIGRVFCGWAVRPRDQQSPASCTSTAPGIHSGPSALLFLPGFPLIPMMPLVRPLHECVPFFSPYRSWTLPINLS